MPASRRNAALLLVAVFLAGLVVGVGGLTIAERSGLHLLRADDHRPGGYLEFLSRELSFTPAQRDSVRGILDRHRPTMDSLRAAGAPPFVTLREENRSEIRAQLTPAQQQHFDDMARRNDSTSNRRNDAH